MNIVSTATMILISLKGWRRSRRRDVGTSSSSNCYTVTVRSPASPCHLLGKSYWGNTKNWNC